MIKSNYFQDNDDLQLQMKTLIDWPELVEAYENGFSDAKQYKETNNERLAYAPSSVEEAVEYYNTLLDTCGDIAGNDLAQVAQEVDNLGLKFENGVVTHPQVQVDVINKFLDAGLGPTSFKRKYGGLGLPHTIKAISMELMYRADTSTTIAMGSMNLAGILEKAASEEMRQKYIPKIISERYSVTMGLSEPDFGSDLPNVKTKAELIDGQWYISGTKRFQTVACGINGGPALTLCLARSGESKGAKALSFFIVDNKHAEIVGIEHKLGLKGSATCEVYYDKAPAELIGQEGYGLVKYVISMLNGARMSVAAQGTGISEAAWREAKKYAEERIQFNKPLAEIPAVARMLDRMQREIMAMRHLMLEGARTVDMYHWRADHLEEEGLDGRAIRKDEQVKYYEKLANTLTPLSKYYNSEMCNSITYDALQVLGGSGYCEDYDIARLYRDARITNIYDGTTQIQVNAAIGGIVAGMSSETGQFRLYLEDLLQTPDCSSESKEIFELLDEMVKDYKELSSENKEAMSFEICETATRLLNGLLLEKSLAKLSGEQKEERRVHSRAYNVDSLAIAQGNKIKIRASSAEPALV